MCCSCKCSVLQQQALHCDATFPSTTTGTVGLISRVEFFWASCSHGTELFQMSVRTMDSETRNFECRNKIEKNCTRTPHILRICIYIYIYIRVVRYRYVHICTYIIICIIINIYSYICICIYVCVKIVSGHHVFYICIRTHSSFKSLYVLWTWKRGI